MMILPDNLEEVALAQLVSANNWQAQYRLITDWGKLIEAKPELQRDEFLIRGCETPAWLAYQLVADRHRFVFDSHSRVMNGLVAVVLSLVNDKTSAELAELDIKHILSTAGLEKHLTPSRSNGLQKIIVSMYSLAGIHS